MKVALVLKYFLPEHVAGTEVYVAALSRGLKQLSCDVLVIKPGYAVQKTQQYFHDGVKVIEYPESSKVDKELITGKRKPNGLIEFEKLLRFEKPDCIHFHEISGSNGITIDHVRIAKKLKIPVFTTLHLPGYVCKTGTFRYKNKFACDGVIDTYKCSVCMLHDRNIKYGAGEVLSFIGEGILANRISTEILPDKLSGILSYPAYVKQHRTVLMELFSSSEKVFVLSNWFKDALIKNVLPGSKMVLLPKALPVNSYDKRLILKNLGDNEEPIRFVYIGRITEIKGLHIVLEALNKVDAFNWSFDIYGQVSDENYYNKCRAISQRKSKFINWKGVVKPDSVLSTLKEYDALVFPTISEEMVGLVVQEAFAVKIPVIGSRVRGIAEQVREGKNGLLFEPGDIMSLTNVLEKVINDKSLLLNLAENIEETKIFDQVVADTLLIYKSSLNKNYIS